MMYSFRCHARSGLVALTLSLALRTTSLTAQSPDPVKFARLAGIAQVIATGSYPLINGGAIRTPGSLVVSWDPTKPNNYGFDLENFVVPPDVWVKNSPADDAKGIDRELKVAIDEAMKMLRNPTTAQKPIPE